MKVVVERYHGLGNDYLVFDPNHNELKLDEANVKMLCDRNEGLGADGVLEGPILKEDGMHVKVWNRTEVNLRPVEMVSAFCKISERCKLCTEKEFLNYIQETVRSKLHFK